MKLNATAFRSIQIAFVLIFVNAVISSLSVAADFKLAWDPSDSEEIAGYYIYYKAGASIIEDETDSFLIDIPITSDGFDAANPQYILELEDDVLYYFVVTAYDENDQESDFSNEIAGMNGRAVNLKDDSGPSSDSASSGCFIKSLAKR